MDWIADLPIVGGGGGGAGWVEWGGVGWGELSRG